MTATKRRSKRVRRVRVTLGFDPKVWRLVQTHCRATGKMADEVIADAVRALPKTEKPQISREIHIVEGDAVTLSALKRYAQALGARCEVVFVFPDGSRVLIPETDDDTKRPS